MKRTLLSTSLIAPGLLAATSAFASGWGAGDSQDLYGHIINDLDKPAFVGTSLSLNVPRFDPYHGIAAGNPDLDAGFAIGNSAPQKGYGDSYGSVLHDVAR